MNNLLQYGSDSEEEESEVDEEVRINTIKGEPVESEKADRSTTSDYKNADRSLQKLQICGNEKPVSVAKDRELETDGPSGKKMPNPKQEESDSENELIGPPIPSHILGSLNKISEDRCIGPPVPANSVTDVNEKESDVGPPVPANLSPESDKSEDSDGFIGPPVPKEYSANNSDSSDSEEGSASEDEDPIKDIPITDKVSLTHGNKPVVAVAIDSSGSRLATGSVDYDVRFWDFAGMDRTLQSFRTLTPCGNNPIKCLDYSSTGDAVLVVSGMSQAKVLDRDGHELIECVKGDQYVTDMARTKGHIAPLTSGCWHPRTREEFLTSSEDSTCRIWDVKEQNKHKSIIKCRAKNGLKTSPMTCAYSRDGNLIACACLDGSIQMWDHRRMFVNTSHLVREAHVYGSETSCIAFSYASTLLATRGGDGTLKLWDLKAFKKPIFTAENLFSRYNSTNCMFSPNDSLIVTGVSMDKGDTGGKMLFFDSKNFNLVREEIVTNSHVIRTLWHPRLQQIFVGCGNGEVKAYFGEKSGRGAQLASSKVRRKKKQVEVIAAQQIITPHALPMFRQDRPKSLRKQMEKDRMDPVKSRRPDLPIKSGQGGRVAASGSTLSSYVIRNLGLSKRIDDDQDPREAILRYAKEAAENPYWISPAYAHTQPKTIFQSDAEDKDEPETKKQKI